MSFLRSIIEMTNDTLGHLKSHQVISLPANQAPVRVNLGCGLAVAKGWINIDGSLNALIASFPAVFYPVAYSLSGAHAHYSKAEYCQLLRDYVFVHHDLSRNIPFKTETVDYIFSSHFFEHLYRKQGMGFLRECHRVLRSGGVLRLSIPDLKYAVLLYQAGQKKEMLENYFFLEDVGSQFSRHKYMYDWEMISDILAEVGFRQIVQQSFRRGIVPDIDILDNRPEDSLFVEAAK